MKTILDEGVPEGLARYLVGHEVTIVKSEGWNAVTNGKLLNLIEGAEFEAFITNDKRMENEQQLKRRRFATLLLSTNHWPTMKLYVAKIADALDTCALGTITTIDCGRFVPNRLRRNLTP